MYEIIATILISIACSVIAWFASDIKSKARQGFIEEKLKFTHNQLEDAQALVDQLNIKAAQTETAHEEIFRAIHRLNDEKASREVVESFRNEIHTLRVDIDKRFDRIERLLTK